MPYYRTHFGDARDLAQPHDRTAIMPTNPNHRTYAADMNAYIARQQWNDYQRRFQPVERQLIDETMGRELLDKRLGGISAIVDNSFNTSFNNARMNREMYGAQPNQAALQSQQRHLGLNQAAATADAMNSTRAHTFDRNMDTLAGGSSAINQAIR